MQATPAVTAPSSRALGASARPRLRRQLGLLGTISLSVGVMAPTLAMSSTGVEPAGLIGRAAPLAFVFAAVGVALVSSGFVLLSATIGHAGSVYAFVGRALGPRAGFVTGWALLGTYLVFPAVSMAAFATFTRAFLDETGLWTGAPWLPLALVGWALMGALASRRIRTAARSLLAFEVVSMLLILALVAIIVVKLASGDAPRGQDLNTEWLHIPAGTSFSTVALAATFGFLSFAGFEAAGSLGEEAKAPRRMVPRSIVAAIAVGAVFYVVCMIAQTLGFGTDAAGVKAFAGSEAPLGDLGRAYVGSGMASALDAVAMLSAVGAGLGCASVAARMLFALGRDRALNPSLAATSRRTGAPAAGLAAVLALDAALLVGFAIGGTDPLQVFFYLATIGVLSLLVMYGLTNVAAMVELARTRRPWVLVLPAAGLVVAGYVLYRNVWPVPPSPFNVFPYLVGAWLLIGIGVVVAVPGLVARVRIGLTRSGAV